MPRATKTAATKTAAANTKAVKAGSPTASVVRASIVRKLRPLGDRLVLRPSPGDERTKSGIVIPDTAKEKPQEGEVLAVGPGRILDDGKREQMDVKKGDKVLYPKYAGTEFKLEGDELLIVGYREVLAVVERRA